MSNRYGPRIVTDGLVLCLDAADRNSYPGTGTTWTDLSGNGNNGILTNGPTFSSNSKGYISFDGVDDYIDCGNRSSLFLLNTSFTLSTWVYLPSNTNKYRVLMTQNRSQTVNTNSYEVGISDTNRFYYYNGTAGLQGNTYTAPTSQWFNLATIATLTGSNVVVKLYLNTVLINTSSSIQAPIDPGSGSFYVGVDAPTGLNQGSFMNGYISIVSVYNRELSISELTQNYNATKGRFNP